MPQDPRNVLNALISSQVSTRLYWDYLSEKHRFIAVYQITLGNGSYRSPSQLYMYFWHHVEIPLVNANDFEM